MAKSAIRHNMSKDVPKLDFPVCLIWGKQDGVTPPHVAEEFHSLFPQSDLYWIDQSGFIIKSQQNFTPKNPEINITVMKKYKKPD